MAHTDSNGPSLAFTDNFSRRHIGPGEGEIRDMLAALGCPSLDVLIDHTVPTGIRLRRPLALDAGRAEFEALGELRAYAAENRVARSLIGMGYYDTITPPVILRNILENPGWYTQYTPYQAEISQGRLEALINFQTMVADLTDLPLANASLLDEATAAAEAMHMCMAIRADEFDAGRRSFFVASDCHPQTIAVVQTRARPLGINVVVAPPADLLVPGGEQLAGCFGVLLQYPTTDGRIECYADLVEGVHAAGALVVAATDLLALTLFKPPGEWGADIAIGSAQRFGVPMGGGGPHAAFMSTRTEFARQMPGRIIGVSKDVHGQPAYRLAIQTREQHIRREKATSNICTAQVLLAVMASMYAVYHGPDGLRAIASRVRALTQTLRRGLLQQGHAIAEHLVFDTLRIRPAKRSSAQVFAAARQRGLNLRDFGDGTIGVSLDETCDAQAVSCVLDAFADGSGGGDKCGDVAALAREARLEIPPVFERCSAYLTHPVFNAYHCEHEMLRYIKRLESRDLSLTTSNIPLGSCTMKLNAAAEMFPVSWPEFARVHPFAPHEQSLGYQRLYRDLERWLAEITGFAAVSLQPNAGSQGEYAGLLAIRAYHEEATEGGEGTQARRHAGTEGKATERRSDEATKGVESNRPRLHSTRDVCLIPVSAHGTNPASAVMAGFRVVPVKCDAGGNVDISDLRAKAAEHADRLGALMITYPSTHGVFEVGIREICEIVHEHGGQVYMDGANMNAQVGLCRPGDIGADVCHLNLHKTFCIPHGGGGPGMGPIAVAAHLAPFLPGHLVNEECRMQSAEWDAVRQNAEARPSRRDAQSPAAGADGNCSSAGDASAFCIDHSAFPVGPVSAAPYGSPSILPISWMYIRMMGAEGLKRATQVAILNANYMASRLEQHYPVLYKGREGRVAHEFIIDCRAFEKSADVKVEDIAKRLMDYGFHAPTMSFPVPGTLMIEPTESESKAELDRLCDALIAIRGEIRDIEEGRLDRRDNPLKNAPHTAAAVTADHWPHAYSRQQAAYPAPWTRQHKFWPAVGRIDNVYGDRNLFCTCVPVEQTAP